LVIRIAEAAGDFGDHGRIERQRAILDALPLRFNFRGDGFDTELVRQKFERFSVAAREALGRPGEPFEVLADLMRSNAAELR
jgi:hypothetical protein